MSNMRFVLNRKGVRELLRSEEMRGVCQKYASDAVGRLGEGYVSSTRLEETRVFASVYAESYKAKKENLENNTILKALGGK